MSSNRWWRGGSSWWREVRRTNSSVRRYDGAIGRSAAVLDRGHLDLELEIDIGYVRTGLFRTAHLRSAVTSNVWAAGTAGPDRAMMSLTCGVRMKLFEVLAALAVSVWRRSSPPLRRGAAPMLGQKALALALDPARTVFERHAAVLRASRPVFRGLQDDADHNSRPSRREGVVAGCPRGLLVVGPWTNLKFGGGGLNFATLAASFDTRASMAVIVEDGTFVGTIDWSAAQDDKSVARGEPFRLGGRAWRAVEVTSESVRVVPTSAGVAAKPPSWRGPLLDVDRTTWETAREILESTEVPAAIDERGELWLEIMRAQWRSRLDEPGVAQPERHDSGHLRRSRSTSVGVGDTRRGRA